MAICTNVILSSVVLKVDLCRLIHLHNRFRVRDPSPNPEVNKTQMNCQHYLMIIIVK